MRSESRLSEHLETMQRDMQTKMHNTACRWNVTTLHAGKCLDDGGGSATHPNAWTAPGMIHHAFQRLGSITSNIFRKTSRVVDACGGSVLAVFHAQTRNLRTLRYMMQTRVVRPPWLWIERRWDETPVHVNFGKMKDLAQPIAKYWWKDLTATAPRNSTTASSLASSSWIRLSHDEYMRRESDKDPESGVLQMLAQSAVIRWPQMTAYSNKVALYDGHKWPRNISTLRTEKIYMPVTFLERNNASTLFQGIDDAEPDISLASLLELTTVIPLIVLTYQGDLDGANGKTKREVMDVQRKHNQSVLSGDSDRTGYCIFWDRPCFSHVLIRLDERAFKKDDLICKLHATAFAFHCPRTFRAQVSALLVLVRKDSPPLYGFHRPTQSVRSTRLPTHPVRSTQPIPLLLWFARPAPPQPACRDLINS
jgi:hypothetical protein